MHRTPTLLIVDDTPMTRDILARLLLRTCPHAAPALAADLAHARTLLRGGHITGVITDYHLPDGTGLNLMTAVRQHDPAVPVVVMSGDTDVAATVHLAGAAGFVAKPFDFTALASVLVQICSPAIVNGG